MVFIEPSLNILDGVADPAAYSKKLWSSALPPPLPDPKDGNTQHFTNLALVN
jgi:hypothetical protein